MIISNPVNLSILQHREYPDPPLSVGGFTWSDRMRRYNWQPGNTPQIYQINRENCNSSYLTEGNLALDLEIRPTLTNWSFMFGINSPALRYSIPDAMLPLVSEFQMDITSLSMPTSDVTSYCGLFSTSDFKAITVLDFVGLWFQPVGAGITAWFIMTVNGALTAFGDSFTPEANAVFNLMLRINRDRSMDFVYAPIGGDVVTRTAPAGSFASPNYRMFGIRGADNTVADQNYNMTSIDFIYKE